jgi:integrase
MSVLSKSDVTEVYQAHEKQRYRDFLYLLSDIACFEDDSWYCEKHLKNVSHNRNHVSISFRQIPEAYREMIKYYAIIRLLNGINVYTIGRRVEHIGKFLRFLGDSPLSEIDIFTASRFKEFLDGKGYTESTCYTVWTAVGNFLSVMVGYNENTFHNPFYKCPYTVGRRLDYKYIPDYVAKQLDLVFMKVSIPLHLRTVYWLLRLIPSRISEVLGMRIDCLKPFDGHFCLTIPSWKQNGGYKEPLLRIIHISDEEIGGHLLALIREQQKTAITYQAFVDPEKKDALFTHRQSMKFKDGRTLYKDVYWPLTYTQIRDNFKKICEEFNIRDENGKIYNVTTHQFRHNGITDRLRAGFTLAQIAEMTAHHGNAMIYGSYAHLDLSPDTLWQPREYAHEEAISESNSYVMFGGRILNMDAITESRLLRNLRAHRVPGGVCGDITHCKNDMWNCLECGHFVPEREQLPYFEKQAVEWRSKAKKFSQDAILHVNFSNIANSFDKIIEKIQQEGC